MSDTTASGVHRVVLVEIVNADQFPGRINSQLPFLAGHLDTLHVPTTWVRFGVSTTNMLEHQRDQVTLADSDFEHLLEVVGEQPATLVCTTDPLFSEQHGRLAATCDQVFTLERLQRERPPLLGAYNGTALLSDPEFAPRYDWQPGNESATTHQIDNIHLALAARCGHRERVNDNPVYAHLDDERVQHRGCAFCGDWLAITSRRSLSGETPPGWVRRQIESIARTRGERPPNGVLMERIESPKVLRECCDALEETGLAAQVRIYIAARTSDVGRLERFLERHFAARQASEQRFGVYASGVESFCGADLERFNKGTKAIDGLRAVNAYRRLARTYQQKFSYTGMTFILLTPWTTPELLALNIGLLRLLRLSGHEASLFQSRLRLHPALPITALAERDGLTEVQSNDPIMVMNRRKLFGEEVPWRFEDARLEPFSRIFVRFELIGTPLADPLTRLLESHLRSGDERWFEDPMARRLDYIDCLVDVLRRAAEPLTEEILLDRALELWRRKLAASVDRAPKRFRIGTRSVSLPELLATLLPLVSSGRKPVLTVDVPAAEVGARESTQVEEAGLCHTRLADGPWVIARDPQALGRYRVAYQRVQTASDDAARRAAWLELGTLHGYPECCARTFADGPFAGTALVPWAAFTMRLQSEQATLASLYPLLVPTVAFAPCSNNCASASATYGDWLQTIAPLDLENPDNAWMFSLTDEGDGELVPLTVRRAGDESLTYSVEDSAAGPLSDLLRRGEELCFLPGQIRVRGKAVITELLTGRAGVWYQPRSWHPEFWSELALAVAEANRRTVSGDAQQDAANPPRDAGDSEHLARWRFLLEAVRERFPTFANIHIVDLTHSSNDRAVAARLTLDEVVYLIRFYGRQSTERCWLRSTSFRVAHGSDTPLHSKEHAEELTQLVRVFDRAVVEYAPDSLAALFGPDLES